MTRIVCGPSEAKSAWPKPPRVVHWQPPFPSPMRCQRGANAGRQCGFIANPICIDCKMWNPLPSPNKCDGRSHHPARNITNDVHGIVQTSGRSQLTCLLSRLYPQLVHGPLLPSFALEKEARKARAYALAIRSDSRPYAIHPC